MQETIATDLDRLGLLIGGMKCGSTAVFSALSQHPQVAPSRPKETHFFSFERHWSRGMDWYQGHFRVRPHHRVALDGSPSYCRVHEWPEAPRRIARLDADVSVVYVLRDPVQRIRSHVRHALCAPWGDRVLRNLDGGVPAEALTGSDYAAHLDAYAEVLPRDRIHVTTLEELRRDPEAGLGALQVHLGLDPHPLSLPSKNRGAPVAWRARPVWHAAYRRARSPAARRAVRTAAYHAKRVPGVRRALFARGTLPLPEGWEETARERLEPSVRRLEREWGVDTSGWSV